MVDLIGIFLVCFLYIIVSWLFFLFIHLFCFDVIFYSLNFHIDRFNKHFCLSYHLSTSLLLSLGLYLSCLSIYLVLLFFFLLVIKLFTLLPCSHIFLCLKFFISLFLLFILLSQSSISLSLSCLSPFTKRCSCHCLTSRPIKHLAFLHCNISLSYKLSVNLFFYPLFHFALFFLIYVLLSFKTLIYHMYISSISFINL